MNMSFEIFLSIVILLVYLDLTLVARLIISRLKERISEETIKKNNKILLKSLWGKKSRKEKRSYQANSYFHIKQAILFNRSEKQFIEHHINIKTIERKNSKALRSLFKVRRIEAAVQLGLIATDGARLALEKSILKEKNYPVKLYIANALSDINNKASLPVLVESLVNSHKWYRDRANMLISDFGSAFDEYLPQIIKSDKIEIKELIVDFSSVYFSENTKNYLINIVDKKEDEVKRIEVLYGSDNKECCAKCIYSSSVSGYENRLCKFHGEVSSFYKCRKFKLLPVSINSKENFLRLYKHSVDIIASLYPKLLIEDRYLNSTDIIIKHGAIKALSNFNNIEDLYKLISLLKDDDSARKASESILEIIQRNPAYIRSIVKRLEVEEDEDVKRRLADILSNRIEYLIMKLSTKESASASEVIKQILLMGRTSEIIYFLNRNKDIDIENNLLAIIKEVLNYSEVVKKDLTRYVDERIIKKCGLIAYSETKVSREEKKDKKLIRTLYVLLFAILMIFPLIYLIRHNDIIFRLSFLEQLKIYIIEFNYYLGFYSITINLIYLGLLILSNLNAKKQLRLWKIKSNSLLFKKRILPSISIVAPAYNEEKTIIESANSLLNLKYPDYELIIVNDGSKDATLDVVIKYFNLIRVDYSFDYRLNTKAVRGIYKNPSIPKLIVVDKDNGGKADSLNAGINISNKEYFCGIDADSLLEDDALLKLTSLILDEGVETPALGGNIFPINGCTIERGQIKDIQIPKNKLARIQTMEYIRSFMAGRLGWARINNLLIISGAFGLFRKERVISVGGYLTSSGKYAKDTVGEDMELVVRIGRLMRELGHKYRICYAFNANCWTEVPEDIKSLKKQRHRWHRGLIDILTFHKKMLFNPKYGSTGMFAMPYFLIFEVIGPIIEIQGYIMVILAFFLGLLNAEIVLLLFVATILMGTLVSISSMVIAEKDTKHFSLKDIIILIGYSIVENFGVRQYFSFWRVTGYINMLKKPTGWGKPERRGFSSQEKIVKG